MKYQVDFFAPIEATKNMLFYNPKILWAISLHYFGLLTCLTC